MEGGDGVDLLDEAEILLKEDDTPNEAEAGDGEVKPAANVAKPAADGKQDESIQVMLRVRPENAQELERNADICLEIEGTTDVIMTASSSNGAHVQAFHFDRIFHSHTDQKEVYDFTCRDMVADVMNGINAAVIAYGQTGSGKTYTMMGGDIGEGGERDFLSPIRKGIIPRMMEDIFDNVQSAPAHIEYDVRMSYVEVYMEKIQDLIQPRQEDLKIQQDRNMGLYVLNATEVPVATLDEVDNPLDNPPSFLLSLL